MEDIDSVLQKRANGQYYTRGNPFQNKPFLDWAELAGLPRQRILEPFAGSNNLITMLDRMRLCQNFESFDIHPTNTQVKQRDTLLCFPKGYKVCVTNPPWLAKNSATARGLDFPHCRYDDVYKFAIEKCLANCSFVAAVIPESFITSNLFLDRLQSFVSLTRNMFNDTDHPVGLALFGPNEAGIIDVWSGITHVGGLRELKQERPLATVNGPSVRFNVPDGNVGLFAVDNTREASIRFCEANEVEKYEIKQTSRAISRLEVDGVVRIREWNQALNDFREKTSDVLLTSFKGIRDDGKYRRRLDWSLARGLIHHVG